MKIENLSSLQAKIQALSNTAARLGRILNGGQGNNFFMHTMNM